MPEISVRLAEQADIQRPRCGMTLNGRDWELSSSYESTRFWNASRRIHFSFLSLEAVYDAHFFSNSVRSLLHCCSLTGSASTPLS